MFLKISTSFTSINSGVLSTIFYPRVQLEFALIYTLLRVNFDYMQVIYFPQTRIPTNSDTFLILMDRDCSGLWWTSANIQHNSVNTKKKLIIFDDSFWKMERTMKNSHRQQKLGWKNLKIMEVMLSKLLTLMMKSVVLLENWSWALNEFYVHFYYVEFEH